MYISDFPCRLLPCLFLRQKLGEEQVVHRVLLMSKSLPAELVYELLTYLPVVALIRFRCVSKQWKSLISDPSFQQQHFRRHRQQDPLLIANKPISGDNNTLALYAHDNNDGSFIRNISIKLPISPCSVGRIQSCHGLICIAYSRVIFISNPSTREVITLPPFQGYNNWIGFGYAASTKEFKVIRFFTLDNTETVCAIFTLGTNGWREARCPHRPSSSGFNLFAPFLNGAIHFMSRFNIGILDDAIYAFDIQTEEYRMIRLPEFYYLPETAASPFWLGQRFSELNGSLCLTFSVVTSMELWILKDYNRVEWVKEYNIVLISPCFPVFWGETLAILGNGTILLKLFEKQRQGERLYWYNPQDKTFTCNSEDYCSTTKHVESLLPLRSCQ